MERGFFKVEGEEFYRYLTAKLEIKEPIAFDDDGFAVVEARVEGAGSEFEKMVIDRKGNFVGTESYLHC